MVSFRWRIILFYFRCLRYYQYLYHFFIPLFKKKNEPKVFCIGYVKTGLTTLTKALKILGYRSVQYLRTSVEPKEGWIEYITNCNYDAFADAPIRRRNIYIEIDKTIPDSKFILTIRDTQSWRRSYLNYFRGSPWDIKNPQELRQFIQRYEDHNKQVIEYFKDRPDKLLIMNIIEGDGWEKLCDFLNKPIPKKSFPHRNVGKYED